MPDSEFDVVEATVADVHAAMHAGDVTAVDLVDAYLARIDAYDGELNAILTVNDGARERAAELDAAFDESGAVGPLHGIPVVLKDNQDTHDMPTTAGAVALAEHQPESDATGVARIREAGGVVLAKANLQEFAFGVDTISSLGGATANAYDTDRRPSGSSGGTAVAVAANFSVLGTGTDTCSSIRSPPAFASCVGVRPTRGLVSRDGVIPLCDTQDTLGPIARTVEDAARLLDVLAGYDPADPVSARGVDSVPDDGYVASLDADGLDGARIGVARQLFGLNDPDAASADAAAEVTRVVDAALDEMRAAGAELADPVAVPDRDTLERPRVLADEFQRDLDAYLDGHDDPPAGSLREIYDSGTIADTVEARIEDTGVLDVTDPEADPDYLRRLRARDTLRTDILARMADRNLDALLYPPSTIPPVNIPANQPFSELNCALSAHTGLPAVVVPAGFTEGGLPVGVELLGRAFAEPRLLELAAGFEAATDHRRPPAAFPALD
ncbi:amidase [Halocalculus aciditolerans]|uniref:Amidase n=1 Tax=Halocalculus aciditolerans TaxID=1383812 RepID=A0A830FIW0_9EURY|nr:amidase family protein [Halocalculus aciditolerans]GGL51428.1 amidase [Halocalculus aciditolerans]